MIGELKPKSSGQHLPAASCLQRMSVCKLKGWRTLICSWKMLEAGGFH